MTIERTFWQETLVYNKRTECLAVLSVHISITGLIKGIVRVQLVVIGVHNNSNIQIKLATYES